MYMSEEGGGNGTDYSVLWGDGRGRNSNSLDPLLDVISNHRRRCAMYYLEANEIADVDQLARYITEVAGDSQIESSDRRINETTQKLIHVDLPKLRKAGVIEYDPRSGTVRYRRPLGALAALLQVCSELEDPSVRSE